MAALGTTSRTPRYQGMQSTIIKRSVNLDRHKTSISLEDEFWEALKEIAAARGMSLRSLIVSIDRTRNHDNLSSALRLFVLKFYQDQAERRASERLAAWPSGGAKAFAVIGALVCSG